MNDRPTDVREKESWCERDMRMGRDSLMERTVVLCLLALSCPLSTHSIFFPTDGSKLSRLLARFFRNRKWEFGATGEMDQTNDCSYSVACVCGCHTTSLCGLFLWYPLQNKTIIS